MEYFFVVAAYENAVNERACFACIDGIRNQGLAVERKDVLFGKTLGSTSRRYNHDGSHR
jgi:hypothetical protein